MCFCDYLHWVGAFCCQFLKQFNTSIFRAIINRNYFNLFIVTFPNLENVILYELFVIVT
jgi:hypothetical protein